MSYLCQIYVKLEINSLELLSLRYVKLRFNLIFLISIILI